MDGPPPLLRTLRHADTVTHALSGEFLAEGRLDLVVARAGTLELLSVDRDSLALVPRGHRTLCFAPILALVAFSLRDASSSAVFADLDLDHAIGADHGQTGAAASLWAAKWRGTDLIVATTAASTVLVLAAVELDSHVDFVLLKQIHLGDMPYPLAIDPRHLGFRLAVHPISRDLATCAALDRVRVHEVTSASAYTSPGPLATADAALLSAPASVTADDSPAPFADLALDCTVHNLSLPDPIAVWFMFYLHPAPLAQSSHLVVVGYRDLQKQAVAVLIDHNGPNSTTAAATTTHPDDRSSAILFGSPIATPSTLEPELRTTTLPLAMGSFPNIAAAFPIPHLPDGFAVVLDHELLILTAADIANGNVLHLRRIQLPMLGIISGHCTIPDCISDSFFLCSDRGELLRASVSSATVIHRFTDLADASLVYIGRDELEGTAVDIVLATSPSSAWKLILISCTDNTVHHVNVHDSLAPISSVVALNPPPGNVSATTEPATHYYAAAGTGLTLLSDRIPFDVESTGGDPHLGIQSLLVSGSTIVLSFNAQSRVLQLVDNEVVDASASQGWHIDTQTIALLALPDGSGMIQVVPSGWTVLSSMAATAAMSFPRGDTDRIMHATLSRSIAGEPMLCLVTQDPAAHRHQLQCVTLESALVHCIDLSVPVTCIASHPELPIVWLGTLDGCIYAVNLASDLAPNDPCTFIARLPESTTPNDLMYLSSDHLLLGTRTGQWAVLSLASTQPPSSTVYRPLGHGPVRFVAAAAMGSQLDLGSHRGVLAVCDSTLHALVPHGRFEGRSRPTSLRCALAAPFPGDHELKKRILAISTTGTLVVGAIRVGVWDIERVAETGPSFVPRKLLSVCEGKRLLVAGSETTETRIELRDPTTMDVQAQIKLEPNCYLTSWCEWSNGSRSKLVIGTAIANKERANVTGGRFFVYQYQRTPVQKLVPDPGAMEVDGDDTAVVASEEAIGFSPKYFSSRVFTGPVRAIAGLTIVSFAVAVGNAVMIHGFESTTRTLAKKTEIELRSPVTAMLARDGQWLAVATVRDSITLCRVTSLVPDGVAALMADGSAANVVVDRISPIAGDSIARHITCMAWGPLHSNQVQVIAADRNGSVVGLAYDPSREVAALRTMFSVQLGYQLVAILPKASSIPERSTMVLVSVSGAMASLDLDAAAAAMVKESDSSPPRGGLVTPAELTFLAEAQEANATREYLAARQPHHFTRSRSGIIDEELVQGDAGRRGDRVRALLAEIEGW
ncbi:hypothetical protein BC828DRAFT_387867 [Blastocladiella britannica]|nr:hypothetical protein BC828DRAFT_387867 [Blastocladiella britannica]